DAVGGEALAQRADDRDAAADGGLVVDVDAALLGEAEELVAVHGEEELVGGDHVPAALDGARDVAPRRVLAADELDHHLHRRVVDRRLDAGSDHLPVDLDEASLLGLLHRDLADDDARAEARLDGLAVVLEELDHARAHVAEAEEADADFTHGLAKLSQPISQI